MESCWFNKEEECNLIVYSRKSGSKSQFSSVPVLMLFQLSFSLTDMAALIRILLIYTGLTGIHSINTVSKVSVKAGESVTIPCLYSSKYRKHVKYLCKGYYWNNCSYAVKTNKLDSSGKFLISDDKDKLVFTVTINRLTSEYTGYYWCVVEIDGGADVGEYFQLSVTNGLPSLYVDQQTITGFIGENITINCHDRKSGGTMRWCRLRGGKCVTSGSSGSIEGTAVIVSGRNSSVFSVTMTGLRPESSGWYWCAKEEFQWPVHLNVTEKSTTTPAASPIVTGHSTTAHNDQISACCRFDLKIFIISLSVLIFIVIVAALIWFILSRKENKAGSSSVVKERAEEEVTYADIKHIKGKEKASQQKSLPNNDVEMLYSSVMTKGRQSVIQMVSLGFPSSRGFWRFV
ncbi:polymeric immunoglobulin receptor-like isoform 2-T2 [Pholidichthys leucotaenia]